MENVHHDNDLDNHITIAPSDSEVSQFVVLREQPQAATEPK
jgi:hypothetical protein